MNNKIKNELDRGAGILLPISSLPSPYGIGTLGKEAYNFVDLLVRSKQKYWQVLPIGPTSFGDSPYQSFSAFAGNPYFIDLDFLVEEELISREEIADYDWGKREDNIDYEKIFNSRFKILRAAYSKSLHKESKEYIKFCKDNSYWLEDYSFFMSLKFHFGNKEWLLWNKDIKFREQASLKHYQTLLKDEIEFWSFCQYKFFHQWNKLKQYANKNMISIIGDIPLYVSMDSADVWVNSELFELDKDKNPINVAGVPPDAFSDEGQRWGNPLYDWNHMEGADFSWWRKRMSCLAELYDVIRIDHFIGVVQYYSIPSHSKTAINGEWRVGPKLKLTKVIDESIGNSIIIAEDLGIAIEEVKTILKQTKYPGMKIIQFAFDADNKNEHLPHTYTDNCVVYGGTHDNETLVGFFNKKSKKDLEYAFDYLHVKNKKELYDAIFRVAYASVAKVAIFQVQDLLGLNNDARMNLPSTVGLNWKWRLKKQQLTDKDEKKLKKLVELYNR